MSFYLKLFLFNALISCIQSLTHDEMSKCSLAGVYKTRQTIIESPNYPNNYRPDSCRDYVIRSPYKCPTTFHIQFLDFYLEYSKDCKNDYVAIGLDNVDDDMDVLCGQVVGIKKYHTPDGVLRLRFFADAFPFTTGKGFKLLVTRLACEREELLRKQQEANETNDSDGIAEDDDDDSVAVLAPAENLQPPESELMQIFRNLTGQEQYQIVNFPPLFGFNYPTQLPTPPFPATGTTYLPVSGSNYPSGGQQNNFQQACVDSNGQQRQLPHAPNYYGTLNGHQYEVNHLGDNTQANYLPNPVPHKPTGLLGGFLTNPSDQYIGAWSSTPSVLRAYDNTIDALEVCCVSAFQQKHFYLSSPGFPRTIFSNILPNNQKRDCVFHVQKSTANVCRLRLDFKFFDFGQNHHGTGNIGLPAIQTTQDVCQEDFIEIDNQRFCGCRSDSTFTAYWTTAADKKLRMRMGYAGIASGGFLLELVQEECTETQLAFISTERPSTVSAINQNIVNANLHTQQQKQQNVYGNDYQTHQHQHQHQQQQQQQHQNQQQQQNLNGASYGINYQVPQWPYISNFPQINPFIPQQLQQLQQSNLYPAQFGLNYYSNLPQQQNFLQPQSLPTNSFGLSQTRYARSYAEQQPVSVVETNSTRKEYYYADNDAFNNNLDPGSLSRSSLPETLSNWDRKDTDVNERQRRKCSFDMGDILRLSVDILWITKPICYAPQRNWFTNWIG